MKASLSLLALALSTAIAAPAFAQNRDDAVTQTNTYLWNEIEVKGKVKVEGEIDVNAESAATVDQDQVIGLNSSIGDGDHTARINGDALRRADGNIGVNLASGVGNAQSNDAAISTITSDSDSEDRRGGGGGGHDRDDEGAMATAMVFSTQGTGANYASSHEYETNYTAELEGNALQNVEGNIGLNIAAGVGNGQSNGMAAAVADGALIAKATADSEQGTIYNQLDSSCGDLDLVAHIGGSALQNASGNIGVNVASGVGNLQHNGLAIASSNCTGCGQ